MIHTISSKYWFQARYHYTSHNSSPLRSRVREGCEEMGIPPDVWISRDIWAWFRIDTVEDGESLNLFFMKKVFVTFAIYIIFILWSWFMLCSVVMITSQMTGCLSYNPNRSFLAVWLDINYFEEKERYKSCMDWPDTYEIIINSEKLVFPKNKELSCKYMSGPDVCDRPNFKPGILYWLLWILIFYSGIRLRKKYVLH